MNLKRISSRVFSLICLFGFLIQVQQVSELYFGFQTTSRTLYQIREVDDYQSIMYCPRSLDLLDRSHHDQYGILSEPPKTLDKVYHELSKLTIADILNLTPHESITIDSCRVRQGSISTTVSMVRRDCQRFFKVIKSVYGERICYTFMPRNQKSYSVGDVATAQTYASIVYQIHAGTSISNSIFAFFISSVMDSNDNTDPLHSRPFQIVTENFKTFNESRFLVFGDSIEIKRLPSPYDTKCTPGHDQEICYETCLIDKFKTINRLPWSGFHREKLDMKMLSSIDLFNESILGYVSESFEDCHSLCKRKTECLTKFSKTTIEQYPGISLVISSMIPSLPQMSLSAVPFINLVEYIVQVGSCFGMWFGMSIISFDPVKWKVTLQNDSASKVVNNRHKRLMRVTCTRVLNN